MRIGIYTHNYPKWKGDRADAGIFVSDFANELSKEHEIFVFNTGPESGKFGNWKLTNPLSVVRFVELFIRKTVESIKFARENRLDFILTFWALPSGVLAYFTKLVLDTPYGVWCLGSDLNFYAKVPILKTLIKLSLKNANFRFANSHILCKIGERFSKRHFNFLPAVTENTYNFSKKIKLASSCINFLFVGRLEKVKGVDVLINAAQILLRNKVKFKINILGDGTMRVYLENLVKKNGLENCIKFIGQANKEMVFSYMKFSDYLVIPSRKESLPLVIVEAAKMGLPMIVAEVGDCGELVRRYKIGKVVGSDNPKKLAKILEEVVSESRNEYKAGLKLLASDFTLEKSVSTFLKYIK